MAFDRPLKIEQWGKELSSRMEAKSHLLHAPMRQSVPTSPELVAKRRRQKSENCSPNSPGVM